MHQDLDEPTEPVDLDFAGHVLLCGLRAQVVGRGDCPLVQRHFEELCGPLAARAQGALFVVMKLLALRSQRRLRVHLPGCSSISVDEMMLLSAIADAQANGAPAASAGRSWMARLTGGVFDPALERAVCELGDLVARSGHQLGLVTWTAAVHAAAAARPTLH